MDSPSCMRRMLCVLVLLATADSSQAQISISESGTPVYSHPIAVAPGISGMVPNLALLYSASSINGPVGLGWSISGISMITRCPSTKALEGVSRGVDYTPADKLCLDGQRLIQVDPGTTTPVASPTEGDAQGVSSLYREYRTEKHSYARIRAYGSAGGDSSNGPAHFTVWTKSGQIYEYGDNQNVQGNSAIGIQGRTAISAWAVSRISDTLKNYIDFRYRQDFDVAWGTGDQNGVRPAVEWNLSAVLYTGNSALGQLPRNRVIFSYEDRPSSTATAPSDRAEAYHLGAKSVSTQRLTSVKAYTNWPSSLGDIPGTAVPVRATFPTYERSPVTGRSRVISLRDCAGPGFTKCLPPVQFTYTDDGGEAYTPSTDFGLAHGLSNWHSQSGQAGVLVLDYNGDGKSDLLYWSDTVSNNKLYRSNGDGTFTQVSAFNITNQRLFRNDGCFVTMVSDMNGDGFADLLRYSGPRTLDDDSCSSPGPVYIYIGKGDGLFDQYALSGPTLERLVSKFIPMCPPSGCAEAEPGRHDGHTRGVNFYLMDVDGDGRMDIVTSELPYYGINQSGTPCGGAVCTKVWKGNGTGTFSAMATNVANKSLYIAPRAGTGLGAPSHIMDFDGDGLADLVGVDLNASNAFSGYRSKGDGNFVGANYGAGGCKEPLDVNGDGRMDCLVASTDATYNGVIVSDGTAEPFSAVSFNLEGAGFELVGSNAGHVLGDFNGDGRTDILRWKDDAAQNRIFRSNGDGTFAAAAGFALTGAGDRLAKGDGSIALLTGDFTGRGGVELLRLVSGPSSGNENRLYVKSAGGAPDLLASVITSTGLKTDLTWVPLTRSASGTYGARYVSDRGSPTNKAQYPFVDLTIPMQVVATMTTDSGVVGDSGSPLRTTTEFKYQGLKAAFDGRGMRGFRETRRQSGGANGSWLTVVTQYLHEFPYIGVASSSSTYLGTINVDTSSAVPRSSVVYTYCEDAVKGSVGSASPTNPCSITGGLKVVRPYLAKTVESGLDVSGDALPTVTTENKFNSNGDPTEIKVTTMGASVAGAGLSSVRTTTNTYSTAVIGDSEDGTPQWTLGRLIRAEQRNTVVDSFGSAGLAASAGTAPKATSTVGSAPAATLSTPSFSSTQVNSTRNATATFSNTGTVNVALAVPSAESVTGARFSFVSTTCGETVAPGTSCSIVVRFSPTATGTATGTLRVVTGPDTYTVNLSGSAQLPTATLGNIAFGKVSVFGSSTLTSTLSNTGVGPLSVTVPSSDSVTGIGHDDFTFVSTTCGSSLAVGASCSVSIKFTPSATVARTGSLAVSTGAGTLTASLSGAGGRGTASLSTSTLTFASTEVGFTSAQLSVTVTNTGDAALSVTGAYATGDFSVTANTCSSVGVNGTCTIGVRFAPATTGTRTGSLAILNNGTTGNRSVSLSGTGTPGLDVAISPASISQITTTPYPTTKTMTFTATAAAVRGSAPYTYSWSKVSGNISLETPINTATGTFKATLSYNTINRSGTFEVTATDSAGRTATRTISVFVSNSCSGANCP